MQGREEGHVATVGSPPPPSMTAQAAEEPPFPRNRGETELTAFSLAPVAAPVPKNKVV